jgi:hypothetical protein
LKEICASVDEEITYERWSKGLPEQSKACKGKVADMGSALYNIGLGAGAIIGPLLGGVLTNIGDKNQPNCIPNLAYDPTDLNSTEPELIGNGFAFAADVMSMVTLSVTIGYGLIGWIFRPKSNF